MANKKQQEQEISDTYDKAQEELLEQKEGRDGYNNAKPNNEFLSKCNEKQK